MMGGRRGVSRRNSAVSQAEFEYDEEAAEDRMEAMMREAQQSAEGWSGTWGNPMGAN